MILSYEAGGALVTIEFDATAREDHQSSTTVTEYHVERGSNVADHARPDNDKVTFDCIVTNTPIRSPLTNTDGVRGQQTLRTLITPTITQIPRILPGIGLATSLLPQGTQTTGVEVLDFDGEFDRVRSVYNELNLLQSSTTLVNFSTSIREYSNMVIRTISAPRSAADGSSITFSFTSHAIRFVDSEIVAVKADNLTKKSKGVKKPEDVTEAGKRSTMKAGAIKAGVSSATVRPNGPPVPFGPAAP